MPGLHWRWVPRGIFNDEHRSTRVDTHCSSIGVRQASHVDLEISEYGAIATCYPKYAVDLLQLKLRPTPVERKKLRCRRQVHVE